MRTAIATTDDLIDQLIGIREWLAEKRDDDPRYTELDGS